MVIFCACTGCHYMWNERRKGSVEREREREGEGMITGKRETGER